MAPRLITLRELEIERDQAPLPDDPAVRAAADRGEALATERRADDASDWPVLEPLDVRPEPPTFPVDALPIDLRRFVEAVAAATLTPTCWGGVLALAAVATVAQEHYSVRPLDAMRAEPLGLGIGIVSPPGTRKSSVFRRYLEPITRIEAERRRAWAAQRDAAAGKPFDWPEPRIVLDDAGPEFIAEALGAHGGQVAVWSPEGAALANACGRYHKGNGGAPIEVYLQAMAGDCIIVDRCGKEGRHVQVVDPALTLAATMQPQVLAGIVGNEQLRGRGLVARIVWVVAHHGVGRRPVDKPAPPVPRDVEAAYGAVIDRLATAPLERDDARRVVLTFDDPAQGRLLAMMGDREPKLDAEAGGELVPIMDWAAKLEGLVGRIAALLALVEGRKSVGELDAARAVRIAAWATEHAKLALVDGEHPGVSRARILWRWCDANGRPSFTKRDAFNALRGRADFRSADRVDAPLGLLVDRGYLRAVDSVRAGAGRPGSPRYAVRP